jgi:proteasome alpha subunit
MEMPTDMQHQAMGYDRTATMFSPDGHLLQVEYAEKTVRLGSASIGMVCEDGVFIIADKRIQDKLIVKESATKVHEIDLNIIASVAGITSDARVLIERAQILAQQHRVTYDTEIAPELVIKDIANTKQQFTQYGGARPFGVSMMLGGLNGKKVELFVSDITGNYFSYHANAIGEGDEKIKELLRAKYKESNKLKEGVKTALEIFAEVQGDKFNINRFEMLVLRLGSDKPEKYEGEKIKEIK